MSAKQPFPKLHHVTFKTTRLEEMLDWYGKALGLTPNYQFPGGAWTSNDDANHRVAFLVVPGLKDDEEKVPHTGMHHLAFEYDDVSGLLETYDRLKGEGIVPHASLDHGVTTSFYYVDPDGNSVELQVDNFLDWSKSTKWMQTAPEFAANPIGVSIDPAKMLAAWRDGADAAELHRLGYEERAFDSESPLDLRLPA